MSCSGEFPQTRWTIIAGISDASDAKRAQAYDYLAANYWKPVYYYALRTGCSQQEAEDLAQGFFEFALEREVFAKADCTRGHFRTFLLRALQNFRISEFRKRNARFRCPKAGFVSIHEFVKTDGYPLLLKHDETPEVIFARAWFQDLLLRVLRLLRDNLHETGMTLHYEILHESDIRPWLEGTERPPQAQLASRLDLTSKEVSRRLAVARQAFDQLLRKEILRYTGSNDAVAQELLHCRRILPGT